MEAVIKWGLKTGVVVLGLVYIWGLLPIGVRPQLSSSPFTKSTQTITLDALTGSDATSRIRTACRAPWVFRPIEQPAKIVHVLVRRRTTLEMHDVKCGDYG